MTPVYYEEYEEVDHMVRTLSGGQVSEVLLVAFSVIACSMSSPELLQTTSSCVEDKSGAAVDVLSLLCTLFWCRIDMWLNSLHFGLDCILQCVFIFFGKICTYKLLESNLAVSVHNSQKKCTSICAPWACCSIISSMLHTGLLLQFVCVCVGVFRKHRLALFVRMVQLLNLFCFFPLLYVYVHVCMCLLRSQAWSLLTYNHQGFFVNQNSVRLTCAH